MPSATTPARSRCDGCERSGHLILLVLPVSFVDTGGGDKTERFGHSEDCGACGALPVVLGAEPLIIGAPVAFSPFWCAPDFFGENLRQAPSAPTSPHKFIGWPCFASAPGALEHLLEIRMTMTDPRPQLWSFAPWWSRCFPWTACWRSGPALPAAEGQLAMAQAVAHAMGSRGGVGGRGRYWCG